MIHLDDEEADSGPLAFIPGSHKHGEQPHVDEQGNFIYRCAGDMGTLGKGVPVIAKRGWVGFHHGLTVHSSAPKTNDLDRRFVVFQYRAQDAVQLAGVIWRCNGYAVSEQRLSPPRARLVDGHVIPMRGNGGRLYDLYAALKPNTAPKSY